jgi:hypothetical protein
VSAPSGGEKTGRCVLCAEAIPPKPKGQRGRHRTKYCSDVCQKRATRSRDDRNARAARQKLREMPLGHLTAEEQSEMPHLVARLDDLVAELISDLQRPSTPEEIRFKLRDTTLALKELARPLRELRKRIDKDVDQERDPRPS